MEMAEIMTALGRMEECLPCAKSEECPAQARPRIGRSTDIERGFGLRAPATAQRFRTAHVVCQPTSHATLSPAYAITLPPIWFRS